MTQAHLQALMFEVKGLKNEIEKYMSTTELEKQNLEAHVDLCAERYKGLHDRLSAIEHSLKRMNEDMIAGQKISIINIFFIVNLLLFFSLLFRHHIYREYFSFWFFYLKYPLHEAISLH